MRVRAVLRPALGVVLAGVLLAAVAVSLFLAPGVATNWLAGRVNLQPAAAIDDPLTANTQVLAADGSLITEFYSRDRAPVTDDRIAPVMKQAIVDIEDSRFYEHGALDLRGTLRAAVTDLRGGAVQGGSTLTQQLVKQTLLQSARTPGQQQAAVADTLARKIVEAHDAIELASDFSKHEILTRYLNTVYFGAGAYGVQAAAEAYFSTDAAHLTLTQAATLAGLVRDPTALDPIDHPQAARQRRDEVLTRMHQLGHLSGRRLHGRYGPTGRRPAGSPAAQRLRPGRSGRVLLRLPADLPDRHARPSAEPTRPGRAHHPDHPAAGPADRR